MIKARLALSVLLIGLMLTACTQSYGTQSATSTSGNGQLATLPAEATMNAIRSSFMTQTAAQAHGQTGPSNTPEFATVAPTTAGAASPTTGTTNAAPTSNGTTPAATTPASTYPVLPTHTPGMPATYTIHEGETAYCLARRFNVDPIELLDINGKTDAYLAMPGDVLKIPNSGHTFPGNRALNPHTPNMSYTVKAGQANVYYVACYFGDVFPEDIAFVNNLVAPFLLTAGKVLRIP